MPRISAFVLLLVIGAFLGLAAWDECELGGEECPPACHLACGDGCGAVTPPESSASAVRLVALEALAPEEATSPSLAAPRPELSPPRAAP